MTKSGKDKILFETRCRQAAHFVGIEVYFFMDSRADDAFEDDGNLHVIRYGTRACFDVSNGQCDSGKEQNRKTLALLGELGTRNWDRARVLVEEDEEDDDYCCPECGRPY